MSDQSNILSMKKIPRKSLQCRLAVKKRLLIFPVEPLLLLGTGMDGTKKPWISPQLNETIPVAFIVSSWNI